MQKCDFIEVNGYQNGVVDERIEFVVKGRVYFLFIVLRVFIYGFSQQFIGGSVFIMIIIVMNVFSELQVGIVLYLRQIYSLLSFEGMFVIIVFYYLN